MNLRKTVSYIQIFYGEHLLVPNDVTLTLKGVNRPKAVRLLGHQSNEARLKFDYSDGAVTV